MRSLTLAALQIPRLEKVNTELELPEMLVLPEADVLDDVESLVSP